MRLARTSAASAEFSLPARTRQDPGLSAALHRLRADHKQLHVALHPVRIRLFPERPDLNSEERRLRIRAEPK